MQAAPRWILASLMGLALALCSQGIGARALSIEGIQAPAPPPRVPQFPAHMRPPGDTAVVERGKMVYGIYCRACHGVDLRGGEMGGPNLLRSDVMLNDAQGELLSPVVRGTRANAGMPALDLPPDDITAVATYIHSVLATARAQGAPPTGPAPTLNILVGDAAAGQAYFAARCGACHSPTGDLQGLAARVPDPAELQNLWVGGGSRRDVTVTVTASIGRTVEGRLDRIDDFHVSLLLADGTRRTFRRQGDVPRVEVHDPLAGHRALLEEYTDRDMHNVTAFLVTLK